MFRSIPTINTTRLALRGMRSEDFERYAEIWAMPDVVRSVTGDVRSRHRAWESFLRNAGHWQMTGFGQWAVIEQHSRRMIGQVGFFFSTDSLADDLDEYPQAGWLLVPQAQGNGYALEAARGAHEWFDRVYPNKLIARISPDNPNSLKLAERLGYKEIRQVGDGNDASVILKRDGPPGIR